MSKRIKRIIERLERERGLVVMSALGLLTTCVVLAAALLGTKSVDAAPATAFGAVATPALRFSGRLSQTKLVQHGAGEVYLNLTVNTPSTDTGGTVRGSADIVVVLDHSGSMSANNRLPFARNAVHELINRMGAEDRLGLVVFDSSAQVLHSLTSLTAETKQRLHQIVDSIQPGSGTNMSAGIELGRRQLKARNSDRPQKLILLSDGEANEGVTDPKALGQMASAINREMASVSTVGMGLGFNEQLMASMADWGGGSFSYLENLERLAVVLDRNLIETRQTFASASFIEFTPRSDVRVLDAGGYPIEYQGSKIRLPLGQLLSGSEKRLTLTLSAPTSTLGSYEIGPVALRYTSGVKEDYLSLPSEDLRLAVLGADKRREAVASVDKEIFESSWLKNNLGVMKRQISDDIAGGKTAEAAARLKDYRGKLEAAQSVAAMPQLAEKSDADLKSLQDEIANAKEGTSAEQQLKQNRLAKKYLEESRKDQR